MSTRPIIDVVVDCATGQQFYGIVDSGEVSGSIVSKAEAVELRGGDWIAEKLVSSIRPEAFLPAIVSTDRRRFTVMPREAVAA